jgi:preprotein translocase subunit YajC
MKFKVYVKETSDIFNVELIDVKNKIYVVRLEGEKSKNFADELASIPFEECELFVSYDEKTSDGKEIYDGDILLADGIEMMVVPSHFTFNTFNEIKFKSNVFEEDANKKIFKEKTFKQYVIETLNVKENKQNNVGIKVNDLIRTVSGISGKVISINNNIVEVKDEDNSLTYLISIEACILKNENKTK